MLRQSQCHAGRRCAALPWFGWASFPRFLQLAAHLWARPGDECADVSLEGFGNDRFCRALRCEWIALASQGVAGRGGCLTGD